MGKCISYRRVYVYLCNLSCMKLETCVWLCEAECCVKLSLIASVEPLVDCSIVCRNCCAPCALNECLEGVFRNGISKVFLVGVPWRCFFRSVLDTRLKDVPPR